MARRASITNSVLGFVCIVIGFIFFDLQDNVNLALGFFGLALFFTFSGVAASARHGRRGR